MPKFNSALFGENETRWQSFKFFSHFNVFLHIQSPRGSLKQGPVIRMFNSALPLYNSVVHSEETSKCSYAISRKIISAYSMKIIK